jgi:hypothetical protein
MRYDAALSIRVTFAGAHQVPLRAIGIDNSSLRKITCTVHRCAKRIEIEICRTFTAKARKIIARHICFGVESGQRHFSFLVMMSTEVLIQDYSWTPRANKQVFFPVYRFISPHTIQARRRK